MPLPPPDENKIKWEKVEIEKDRSFIEFDDWKVGVSVAGIFVIKKEGFFGDYYIIEKFNGEIVKINETSDLRKKMEKINEKDYVRITRLEDLKSHKPDRNDMMRFDVERGE